MNDKKEKSLFDLIEDENLSLISSKYLSNQSNTPELYELEDLSKSKATILHTVVFQNSFEIYTAIMTYLKRVLSKKDLEAFINKKTVQGVTAIHYASFKGNIKIIKDLIENGADKLAVTNRELNVMHYAAQGNQPNSLVFFKDLYNMDIKSKDKGGSTPLHWAAYAGAESALAYLLTWDVDINDKDNEDFTPLHLAVVSKQLKSVKRLLQKGASVKPSGNSKTPRQLAEDKKYYAIAKVLKESEKCQLCAFKAPVKKMTHNRTNIYIVFIMQTISACIMILVLFPILTTILKTEECKIFYGLHYSYLGVTFLFFVIYIYLIFSNPGVKIPPKQFVYLTELDNGVNLAEYCPKCKVQFTKSSKHCVICDKCTDNFDHHCYWVNNCIGGKNYNTFLFFLFIAVIDVGYLFGLSIFGFFEIYSWKLNDPQNCYIPYIIDIDKYQSLLSLSTTKLKVILYSVNGLFTLMSLLFLLPICLLCFCHSRNLCRKIMKAKPKTQKIEVNSTNTASLLENEEVIDSEDQSSSVNNISSSKEV